MSTAPLEGRRILVVEDDYIIARDVAAELGRAGATVVGPAPSVARALRLLGGAGVDAAVLDVNLGGENSFSVAAAREGRRAPLLFSTGYNSADIPPEWRHATVVMKPLRKEAVADLLGADGPR